MQSELLFPTHEIENNAESQSHLDQNKKHFSAQCTYLFNWLAAGNTITVYDAISTHHIAALPRRISDLKANGILISDKWNESEVKAPKYKIYFMTTEQIQVNKQIVNNFIL